MSRALSIYYFNSTTMPVTTSAPAHTESMLIQAVRRKLRGSLRYTTQAASVIHREIGERVNGEGRRVGSCQGRMTRRHMRVKVMPEAGREPCLDTQVVGRVMPATATRTRTIRLRRIS
jgi:hypothetical protein